MDTPYYTFNREERNLAALLYHLLLSSEKNLGLFLDQIEHNPEWPLSQCEVYFEYAWLRDKWHKMPAESKYKWVLDRLPEEVEPPSVEENMTKWNQFFGLTTKPSKMFIQSPANWVLSRIDKAVQGEQFRELAMFKWAFNIKPDLVIITGNKSAVCIEAKSESKPGKYPTSKADKEAWKKRNAGEYIDQLHCQRNLFEKVVKGFEENSGQGEFSFKFVLVDDSGLGGGGFKGMSWRQIFKALESTKGHPFVKRWVDEIVIVPSGSKKKVVA